MDIYERLGVKKLINAWGTVTRVGGSLVDPSVMEAMTEASRAYIDFEEYHTKAGQYIAKLIGVEAAFISSGAAAGIAIATAACIVGTDSVGINQLPDTTGLKDEVILLKSHRSRYDQGIRMVGGKLVEVGYADLTLPEQLERAINEKTAMCFYLAESEYIRAALPLKMVASIMNKHNIPVVVDAAAEIPPRENLTRYLEEGASLVVFSGGKDIHGPQSSGLVLGRADLIKACHANACPNHSVGRSMKVDKETVAGIVRAVELYIAKDMDADLKNMEAIVDAMLDGLKPYAAIMEAYRGIPSEPGIQPVICPRVYVKLKNGMDPSVVKQTLFTGEPGIVCGLLDNKLVFNSQLLQRKDVTVIIKRLAEVLNI